MVDWPNNDLINWVRWRIRAFEVARENTKKGIMSDSPDHPLSELDLRIWLASQQERKSLSVIAQEIYPREWKKNEGRRGNQSSVSRIRRSVARVEKYLNRGEPDFYRTKKQQRAFAEAMSRAIFG